MLDIRLARVRFAVVVRLVGICVLMWVFFVVFDGINKLIWLH